MSNKGYCLKIFFNFFLNLCLLALERYLIRQNEKITNCSENATKRFHHERSDRNQMHTRLGVFMDPTISKQFSLKMKVIRFT